MILQSTDGSNSINKSSGEWKPMIIFTDANQKNISQSFCDQRFFCDTATLYGMAMAILIWNGNDNVIWHGNGNIIWYGNGNGNSNIGDINGMAITTTIWEYQWQGNGDNDMAISMVQQW